MTPAQKKLLKEIAAGADVNVMASFARLEGGREARDFARTVIALLRVRYLQRAWDGGLEISEAGRAAARYR